MKKITLTKDQEIAVKESEAYINGNKHQKFDYATISGIAGSGKTKSVEFIIDSFKDKSILGIAISHAAVGQLSQGLNIECVTLAKALNKKPVLNKKTGIKKFKIVASLFDPPMISGYDLLVIDECSMISEEELTEIMQYKDDNAKIIFLGDICQIKPINSKFPISPTFNNAIIELKEVMRFKHPLTKLNLQYRNHILEHIESDFKTPLNTSILKFEDDITGLHNIATKEGLIEAYIKNYDPENIGKCRITAYRNNTIDFYNNIIRKRLLGDNISQILKGDLIIANEPYRQGLIKNNEFLKVTKVIKANFSGVKGFLVDLENQNKARISDVKILDQKNLKGFYIELDKLKARKKWKEFYKLKESFLNYSYSHATTSHKLQGSTVENVFVDVVDILSVTKTSLLEKLQSIYVGISRASKKIFVYGANFKY